MELDEREVSGQGVKTAETTETTAEATAATTAETTAEKPDGGEILRKWWKHLVSNKTILFVLAVIAVVLGVIAIVRPSTPPPLPPPPGIVLGADAETNVNEALRDYERAGQSTSFAKKSATDTFLSAENSRLSDNFHLGVALERGLYLLRGNRGVSVGKGFPSYALSDFKKAAAANNNIADPFLGAGVLIFDMAIYDIVYRQLYVGGHRAIKGLVAQQNPYFDVRLLPDAKSQIILKAALEQLRWGMHLRQLEDENHGEFLFYTTDRDIREALIDIPELLNYSLDAGLPREQLKLLFVSFVSKVNAERAPAKASRSVGPTRLAKHDPINPAPASQDQATALSQ